MSLQEISSTAELEEAIEHDENVMVVFSKDNCPACATQRRWLDGKAEELSPVKVVVAKLEKLGRTIVEDFGLRTMPTTVLFKNGDEVYRVPGFHGPTSVENAINAHLQTA